MRARRTRRADRARLWADAFDFAMSELGTHEEPPGSNSVEFSEWYGVRGPWGLMFVSWCYASAGSRAFSPGRRYSYAPHLLADAVRSANRLSVTERPLQGDLVIYDLDGDGVADHAGMFDAWRDPEWHELRAIEGVSSCFGENGGEVMLRSRPRATCSPSCTFAGRRAGLDEPDGRPGTAAWAHRARRRHRGQRPAGLELALAGDPHHHLDHRAVLEFLLCHVFPRLERDTFSCKNCSDLW